MTAPLVSPEVDLHGYEFMPLYGDRLFASKTWISASAEAKIAALRLWWHAFSLEVPAASLPDDDLLLSEYSGYGIAVKAWKRIRPSAMSGWILCDDGRWYHPFLAKRAIEAWDKRLKDRERKARFLASRRSGNADGTRMERGKERSKDAERNVPGTRTERMKRSDRKGKEVQNRDSVVDVGSVAETPPKLSTGPNVAVEKSARATPKINGAGQRWSDPAYVAASAATLGIPRRQGEADDAFKDRVFAAAQGKRRESRP